jgi:ribokinase
MSKAGAKVVVVGSLNVDYIASVGRLPGIGETVPANGLIKRFGGKGANQAIAAARQGANVSMIGCLGGDLEGRIYRERLADEGIDVRGISINRKVLTGTALIAVDEKAENTIIVAAGANGALKSAAVRALRQLIQSASAILLQQEVPMEAVVEAMLVANRANVPVVFNPSPTRQGFPWSKCRIDTLIVNEGEAESIFGLRIKSFERQGASKWRSAFQKLRIEKLIITRGAKTTLYLSEAECEEIPTLPVRPIDTVGAGDAFAGAFTAHRANGTEMVTAIQWANCSGALATLGPGAQDPIPDFKATQKAFRRLAPFC